MMDVIMTVTQAQSESIRAPLSSLSLPISSGLSWGSMTVLALHLQPQILTSDHFEEVPLLPPSLSLNGDVFSPAMQSPVFVAAP